MLSFGRSKRTVNISIDDYALRMVENNGKDLISLRSSAEKYLPKGMIENGRIIDEPAFYQWMKETVSEWGIKHRNVRFFVPQPLVILREIELPSDVEQDGVKQYITMEIGNTIHFPFKNPIFDIYPMNVQTKKTTVIAAPEDEILKFTEIFSDVSLKTTAIEIQPLGIYRYFLSKHPDVELNKVYMIIEYNLSSVNISIFHNHKVEFLRHQPLNVSKEYWEFDEEVGSFEFIGDDIRYQGEIDDQLNEIERLMNFYRFSIHHGNKEVNELILVGDSPHLEKIQQLIKQRYNLPTSLIDVQEQLNGETIKRNFIPTLGLALRGGK